MKTAARIMYIVGTIFAVLGLVAGIFMLGGGLAAYFMAEDAEPKAAGMTMVIAGAIIAFVYLLVTVLGTKGRKAIGNRKTDLAPHILSIILGLAVVTSSSFLAESLESSRKVTGTINLFSDFFYNR